MHTPRTALTDTEERILEAALHVFALRGKQGARMQEIADRAGINKALLHYYFRSKERLYDEVFGFVFRRLSSSFADTVDEAETFEQVLRLFIRQYITFIDQHIVVTRLMMNEILSGAEVLTRRIADFLNTAGATPPQVFLERMKQAIRSGEVRPLDPIQTLLTVISSCVFFLIAYPVVQAIDPRAATDRQAYLEARKTHLFELLYHGMKAES